MHKLSGQDFWAGLMFMGVALAGLLLTRSLHIGTADQMGPGYVPRLLSIAIAALGALIAVRALVRGSERVEIRQLRPLILISAAAASFAFLLPWAGIVPALVVLVILSSLASREWTPGSVLGLSIVLSAFCVLVFKVGVGLNFTIVRGVW